MERFYVSEVKNKSYRYFLASYPGEKPRGSRGARPRAQKMFSTKERAEEFLRWKRREYKGGMRETIWGSDQHWDAIRGLEILSDTPGTTLEQSALLMKLCVSRRESLRGNYAAATDRRVELHPRLHLALENEARSKGTSTSEVCEGIISWWLQTKVGDQVLAREREERRGYAALQERNRLARSRVRLLEEEARLEARLGMIHMDFKVWAAGEGFQRECRNAYERQRRRKRKLEREEREAKEQRAER